MLYYIGMVNIFGKRWSLIEDSVDIPYWVSRYIKSHRRIWNMNAPRYRGRAVVISGKHFKYKIMIDGQSADAYTVWRMSR